MLSLLGSVGITHVLAALALLVIGSLLYMFPYTAWRSPLRNLPGPRPSSAFFGSLKDIVTAPVEDRYLSLASDYGTTYKVRGLLGQWRIVSTDTHALSHVLRHTGQWHRNPGFNSLITRIVGPGVLAVEGDTHRRQRRILNSTFNGTSVAEMVPMFWEEAYILKDAVDKRVAPGGKQGARVDMLQEYIGTALDVIGRAGFNYRFNSHDGRVNPLAKAFNDMINTMLENRTVALINSVMPAAMDFPTKNVRATRISRGILDGIGKDIVATRKSEIARDHISLEKGEYEGRDVLSLCLRANMVAEERDKMSDDEILGQIGTLMLAGNETSATALSWATLHLSQRPEIQARLREECMSVTDDRPDGEELNALPYLDKFVRELLRFDPPLPQVVRTAAVDCVLPLSKPVTGRDGSLITELHVSKGTDIVVPINNIQRLPEIWGDDANTFNPDRFDDPTIPRKQLSGVWGGLMSFIGGPHHCLGYRFALLEIKAVLFVMMRNFSFEPLPTNPKFTRVAVAIIQRPVIVGDEATGMQMPVMVKPLEVEV